MAVLRTAASPAAIERCHCLVCPSKNKTRCEIVRFACEGDAPQSCFCWLRFDMMASDHNLIGLKTAASAVSTGRGRFFLFQKPVCYCI